MRKIIDVHEGVDGSGDYSLSAAGRAFPGFPAVLAAFPPEEYVLIFHPRRPPKVRSWQSPLAGVATAKTEWNLSIQPGMSESCAASIAHRLGVL
jgi:hypothetical protein